MAKFRSGESSKRYYVKVWYINEKGQEHMREFVGTDATVTRYRESHPGDLNDPIRKQAENFIARNNLKATRYESGHSSR